MKLPHFVTDDHTAHFVILLLTVTNSLLIILIFIILVPQAQKALHLPKIVPVSAQTPIVRFNLVSPQANSTVSGNVPLVTTLSNGPKIVSAQLYVDGQRIQAVTSQKTQKLTLFWDTTKHNDGTHNLEIRVTDDQNMLSSVSTSINIQNNVSRNVRTR